jgi:hypothetical protein
MTHAFVFVCQAGEIEAKAGLLAASLRRHLPATTRLIAGVPGPAAIWGAPAADTIRFLASLDIEVAAIVNPFGTDYPIGNKIPCIDIAAGVDHVVFLDSDVIVLEGFDPARHFGAEFSAKPADLSTFLGTTADWRRAYALAGVAESSRRVFSTVTGEGMWPYFNAGVIGVPAACGFGRVWAACAATIDADGSIPSRRPHLDQIALPVAAARAGLRFTALPEPLNFPAHLKPLPATGPMICHYHQPGVIAREPRLIAAVGELIRFHPALATLLDRDPAWRQPVAECRAGRRAACPPSRSPATVAAGGDALITGIPRSGTSLLCRLLDGLPGHAVINEPAEIFAALEHEPRPWGMPILHREWRRRIQAGEAIDNKVVAGRVVDDTAVVDERVPHVSAVPGEDFVLWTKNTLAYAARLAHLADVMPEAAIVACVRHPFDAIASWLETFPHLRDADVDRFSIGGTADPLLSDPQRRDLAAISGCTEPPLRRALLWRHLAGLLLTRRRDLHVVRYEDLAADPGSELTRFLGPTFSHLTHDAIPPLVPRSRRAALSAADVEAIADVCVEPAAALGYDLHVDAVTELRLRGVRA